MSNTNSLSEFLVKIRDSLLDNFPDTYWVKAEINEIRNHRSGHCYLELIEKEESSDKIAAKIRATIWSYTYHIIRNYFYSETGRELSSGMKIMVSVTVEYHEIYGLSLNIKDIEPAYTIGDLALKRKEIIQELENQGVLEMNRNLEIPLVPQKIAIISSDSAAGYGDFIQQITNNNFGYYFDAKLFTAKMQGNLAVDSIITAFDKIYDSSKEFDLVVLIRGGGSRSDLSCFDSFELAYYITQFPIPVITGIGHERDDSIADLVAHTKVKTPTAVAEFLISKFYEFEANILGFNEYLKDILSDQFKEKNSVLEKLSMSYTPLTLKTIKSHQEKLEQLSFSSVETLRKRIENQYYLLDNSVTKLRGINSNLINSNSFMLERFTEKMEFRIKSFLKTEHKNLDYYEKTANHLNPINILKRGFSITRYNGNAIKSTESLSSMDIIQTELWNGEIESKITKTTNS